MPVKEIVCPWTEAAPVIVAALSPMPSVFAVLSFAEMPWELGRDSGLCIALRLGIIGLRRGGVRCLGDDDVHHVRRLRPINALLAAACGLLFARPERGASERRRFVLGDQLARVKVGRRR